VLLAGCATQSVATSPSATAPKEANVVGERDTNACFTNASGVPVTIKWLTKTQDRRTNTFTAEGELGAGDQFCGEGHGAVALVTFSDGFNTQVAAGNKILAYPFVTFTSPEHYMPGAGPGWIDETYATAKYAQMETLSNDVGTHHFTVFRQADTDWINFAITIDK
jgi:hypothetical protein